MALPQPVLDIILIPTYTTKTIGIADASQYPSSTFNITNPTIEITPPGFKKTAITFEPRKVNVFNGDNLGLCVVTNVDGLVPLPDGIWTVKYSISPNNTRFVERSFMRTEAIECRYSKAFLKLDLTECDNEVKKYKKAELNKIRMFIDGSVASANDCNLKDAYQLYQKADQLLNRFVDGQCECK